MHHLDKFALFLLFGGLSDWFSACVFISPLSGGNVVNIFEGSGKVELIGISYRIADVGNGQFCQLEQFGGFCHTVSDQKFLRGFSHSFPEDFTEIAAV